uniref:Uncharacterized protein n=1 Tax=Arundo donax TaxID=35708 RepID=A0A0A9CGK4_ARUDO
MGEGIRWLTQLSLVSKFYSDLEAHLGRRALAEFVIDLDRAPASAVDLATSLRDHSVKLSDYLACSLHVVITAIPDQGPAATTGATAPLEASLLLSMHQGARTWRRGTRSWRCTRCAVGGSHEWRMSDASSASTARTAARGWCMCPRCPAAVSPHSSRRIWRRRHDSGSGCEDIGVVVWCWSASLSYQANNPQAPDRLM